MREIKFRAWDRARQIMADVTYINFEANIVGYAYRDGSVVISSEQVELTQYTGLKDVNGVEIYEGDIVKWGDQPNGHESPIRIGVIELNPDIQFITNVGIFEYGRFSYKETNKYLTIIGDKFVNPELLGAGL